MDRVKRWLIVLGAGAVVLLLSAAAIAFFSNSDLAATDPGDLLDRQKEEASDPEPQTFEERLDAEPSDLLPSEGGGIPDGEAELETEHEELIEPEEVSVLVPPGVKKELQQATTRFLLRWDDFDGNLLTSLYRRRLASLVVAGADTVLSRADSVDLPEVCTGCVVGQHLMKPYPRITILDYEGSRAYVAAVGRLRYDAGGETIDGLHGRIGERWYRLVFRRVGSQWLVERVVADTGRVS